MRPDAVIFDMDGTLVDISSVRGHVVNAGRRKDFDAFHRAAIDCPPHGWVVRCSRRLARLGFAVLIVTARGARYRNSTAFWLAMHNVPSDAMWMRADGDHRPDYEVKRDILAKIRRSYNPLHAFDDNPNVIALWREEGIGTTVVPGWITKED